MKNCLFVILLCIPTFIWANDSIQGKWSVEDKNIYIGQQFYVELEVKAPTTFDISLPESAPQIKGAETIGKVISQNLNESNFKIYKKRYHFIAFDSLNSTVESVEIPYTVDGKSQSLTVKSTPVSVSRIPVDENDVARASYGPIAPIEKLNWNLFFIIIGILIVAGAVVAFLQWKKSKSQWSIPADADPKEWALQQIEILEKQVPFQSHKSSWIHLTEVLRLYMQRVWDIPAPYFSTGEILVSIAGKEQYQSQLNKVATVLELGDQVKFAREHTTEEQQKSSIQLAKEIIQYQYIPSISVVKEEVLDE